MGTPRMRKPPSSQQFPARDDSLRPLSAFEDFVLFEQPISRPQSTLAASRTSSPVSAMGSKPPTLSEILLDVSSPPWTLTAFMAYLSQNHCMETLEFTLDLQRYTSVHRQLHTDGISSSGANDQLCLLWDKLMQVYIAPCSPREVNIPACVRDRLLRLPTRPSPPPPSELEEAGRIVYELMNDSLLVPFLESVSPMSLDHATDEYMRSPRHSHQNAHTGPSSRSPSTHVIEPEGLTDDSEGNSPASTEPMTPPTTPPTTSDWSFTHSPGGFHRAMTAHKDGWKKMGAKLGLNRKSMGRRPTPTSADYIPTDTNRHSNPL
ncbi:hypothetical protein N3K66_006501 [Trichothecium roseum]|uniref:Uncharacterized protein n=1 Tax=Trichothecium roseum TaxID=47278 RepID=A0ACC0UWQ8_9HYPO|nr:hypothetical protein N3K66_006501 [Trichothecium roseum]